MAVNTVVVPPQQGGAQDMHIMTQPQVTTARDTSDGLVFIAHPASTSTGAARSYGAVIG